MQFFEKTFFACLGILIIAYWLYPPSQRLMAEDGFVENLSALFWLFAAIVSIKGAMHFQLGRRWFFILATIVTILACGEEISWGQRFFDFQTPELIAKQNRQGEFNLHNLHVLTGGSSWRNFLKTGEFNFRQVIDAQNLFRIGFYSYFFLLPLFCLFSTTRNKLLKFGYVKPSNSSLVCLWLSVIWVYIVSIDGDKSYLHDGQEIREMTFAFYIFAYVYFVLNYWKIKKILT